MKPLAELGDLENLLLELFDHLLLIVSSLLSCIGDLADLISLSLVIVVEFLVMLGKVTESLTRGRLNLERFDLLENIGAVHTFNNSVYVSHELFFEHLCILR